MDKGYIKLYRKILKSCISPSSHEQEKQKQRRMMEIGWWTYILLKANWKDSKTGPQYQNVNIQRGQLLTSITKMAHEWGVSRDVVRSWIKKMEALERIQVQRYTAAGHSKGFIVITVSNYDNYQGFGGENATAMSTTISIPESTAEENDKKKKSQEKRDTKEGQSHSTNHSDIHIDVHTYEEDKNIRNNSTHIGGQSPPVCDDNEIQNIRKTRKEDKLCLEENSDSDSNTNNTESGELNFEQRIENTCTNNSSTDVAFTKSLPSERRKAPRCAKREGYSEFNKNDTRGKQCSDSRKKAVAAEAAAANPTYQVFQHWNKSVKRYNLDEMSKKVAGMMKRRIDKDGIDKVMTVVDNYAEIHKSNKHEYWASDLQINQLLTDIHYEAFRPENFKATDHLIDEQRAGRGNPDDPKGGKLNHNLLFEE